MNNIGAWQVFVVYSVFIMGSISTIGGTTEAGRDSYFAFLIGGLLALILYRFYFSVLYTHVNLQGIKRLLCKLLLLLCVVSGIFTAALAQYLCTAFLSETTLLLTPTLFISVFIAFTVLLLCQKGVSVLARICELLFGLVLLMLLFSTAAGLQQGNFLNILPFFEHGIADVCNGIFTSVMFPFAEGMFAIILLCSAATEEHAKKGIYGATIFFTLLLSLTFLKNIAVLGFPLVGALYFPTYTVTSVISLGAFFQRFEVLISIAFFCCQMIKISCLILFSHRILCKVFGKKESEIPISLLVLLVFNLSSMLFPGLTQAVLFLSLYRYLLLPATIFAPLLFKLLFISSAAPQALQK